VDAQSKALGKAEPSHTATSTARNETHTRSATSHDCHTISLGGCVRANPAKDDRTIFQNRGIDTRFTYETELLEAFDDAQHYWQGLSEFYVSKSRESRRFSPQLNTFSGESCKIVA